jgi:hypothetical protein
MHELLVQVWLFGSDSLIAGLFAGPVVGSWRGRVGLAVLFGVCDGAGTLFGALLPHAAPSLADVVLYLGYVLLVVMAARRSSFWLVFMPLVLGLDNLVSGAPVSSAPTLAVASATLALVGMSLSIIAISGLRYGYARMRSNGRSFSGVGPFLRS